MPLDNPIDFKFSAPRGTVERLDRIKKELLEIPKQYKDVLNPSFKSKVGKLLTSKGKQEFNKKKAELEQSLKPKKEEVTKVYSEHYADKDIRKMGSILLNTIESYCKKAGIKTIETKLHNPYSTHVKMVLEEINKIANKMRGNLEDLRGKAILIDQEEALFGSLQELQRDSAEVQKKGEECTRNYKDQVAERVASALGKDIEAIEKEHKTCDADIAKSLVGIRDQDEKALVRRTLEAFDRFGTGYDELLESISREGADYQKAEVNFKRFLKDLQAFEKDFAKEVKDSDKLRFSSHRGVADIKASLQGLGTRLEAITKKAKKINEFAKEMEKYKVFDANMGVETKDSLSALTGLQKTTYGHNILCASQDCFPIAIGEKPLQQQYNHSKDSTNVGAKYILVDEKSQKVKEAVAVDGWETINKSGCKTKADETKALREVEEYLQKALAAATFDKKQFSPKLTF